MIQEDMPMEEAWMKFEATGRVTDYLKLKGIEAESMPERYRPAERRSHTPWSGFP